MSQFDLLTPAVRLDMAMQALQAANSEVKLYWNDRMNWQIQQEFLDPLEPRVKRALDALRSLAEVVNAAHRQCEE